jgi:hypothetical protein
MALDPGAALLNMSQVVRTVPLGGKHTRQIEKSCCAHIVSIHPCTATYTVPTDMSYRDDLNKLVVSRAPRAFSSAYSVVGEV